MKRTPAVEFLAIRIVEGKGKVSIVKKSNVKKSTEVSRKCMFNKGYI